MRDIIGIGILIGSLVALFIMLIYSLFFTEPEEITKANPTVVIPEKERKSVATVEVTESDLIITLPLEDLGLKAIGADKGDNQL